MESFFESIRLLNCFCTFRRGANANSRHGGRSASFASEGTQSTSPCSARHPCPKPQVFPTIRHNSPPQSMSDSPSSRRLRPD